jgi:predicted dienelactone hydrolase
MNNARHPTSSIIAEHGRKLYLSENERAAVAYGYLVRQLKYPGCNVGRVNTLLAGVKRLLIPFDIKTLTYNYG